VGAISYDNRRTDRRYHYSYEGAWWFVELCSVHVNMSYHSYYHVILATMYSWGCNIVPAICLSDMNCRGLLCNVNSNL
jgi:hypothetical protein